MMKARRIDGRLRIHAEAHPVDHGKQGDGNDGGAAGRAGDETKLAIANDDRGRHRTERPLAWANGVGFGLNQAEKRVGDAGLRGEVVHFIVEEKSCGGCDVRAVAVVQREGAGDGVSGGVDDGEVRRVRTFAEADDGVWLGAGTDALAADMRIAGVNFFAGRGASEDRWWREVPWRSRDR